MTRASARLLVQRRRDLGSILDVRNFCNPSEIITQNKRAFRSAQTKKTFSKPFQTITFISGA